jgi:hypothetical protein
VSDSKLKVDENGMEYCWDRGRVLERVGQNLSLNGKDPVDYGENPVETLADALGISRGYAYRLRTLYQMITLSELRGVMKRAESEDYRFGWGHFQEILVCPKSPSTPFKHHRELIDVAISQRLTVKALREEIASRFPKEARAGTSKATSMTRRIQVQTERLVEVIDTHASALLQAVGSVSVDDLDMTVTKLAAAGDRLLQTAERIRTKMQSRRGSRAPVSAGA